MKITPIVNLNPKNTTSFNNFSLISAVVIYNTLNSYFH